MESGILAKGPAFKAKNTPAFRIETTGDVVTLERFWSLYGSNAHYWLEQATPKTLVLKHVMLGRYRNTVPGRLFIEDVTAGPWELNRQTVWAWQLNPEGGETKIMNQGGKVWIMGLKTEDQGTAVTTTAGGKTEIVGGLLYPGSPKIPADQPAFLNRDAQFSVVIAESHYKGGGRYRTIVQETRKGVTKTLTSDRVPKRGSGMVLPLYVGYQ
jgi:hypothetical protein